MGLDELANDREMLAFTAALELAQIEDSRDWESADEYFVELGKWSKKYRSSGVDERAEKLYRESMPEETEERKAASELTPAGLFLDPAIWARWEEKVKVAVRRVCTDPVFAAELSREVQKEGWDRAVAMLAVSARSAIERGYIERAVMYRVYERTVMELRDDLRAALQEMKGEREARSTSEQENTDHQPRE